MKIHFAEIESHANESDNTTYWSDAICGIESENLEDDWDLVDCKKCLKRKIQYKQEQEIAIEQSCDDMEGFVKFMENKK
nr:hypothetical protein [uncultured archaeon]